jgi:hypothetical protein
MIALSSEFLGFIEAVEIIHWSFSLKPPTMSLIEHPKMTFSAISRCEIVEYSKLYQFIYSLLIVASQLAFSSPLCRISSAFQ